MDKFPITLDGKAIGELTVVEEGLYRSFQAQCRRLGPEVFRLYAVGTAGRLRLGIPEPKGGLLLLCRKLSAREAAAAGPLLRGELRPCGAEDDEVWQPVSNPEQLFRNAFFKERLRGVQGALSRREDGVRCMALPYSERRPFPLVPLFCFARIRWIGGQMYAVFCFDQDENPLLR